MSVFLTARLERVALLHRAWWHGMLSDQRYHEAMQSELEPQAPPAPADGPAESAHDPGRSGRPTP
jgi:hypothetical protein